MVLACPEWTVGIATHPPAENVTLPADAEHRTHMVSKATHHIKDSCATLCVPLPLLLCLLNGLLYCLSPRPWYSPTSEQLVKPTPNPIPQVIGVTGERNASAHGVSSALVLFISHNLELEGASLYMFRLAKELTNMGRFSVSVASLKRGPLLTAYTQIGCEVHICQHTACFLQLMHAHTISILNTVIIAPLLKAVQNKDVMTIVWIIHESERAEYTNSVPELASRKLFTIPSYVVFVSCETARAYADMDADNFVVIHGWVQAEKQARCGACSAGCKLHFMIWFSIACRSVGKLREDARRKIGASANTIVVTVVGTICERKAQLQMVLAFNTLLCSHKLQTHVLIVLIGDDSPPTLQSRSIHTFINTHNLTNNVRIIPKHMTAVRALMHAADIHWSNSRSESFPLNILEAMSLRVPVVSTQVHGMSELACGDGSCATVYQGEDWNALVRTMQLILNTSQRPQLLKKADAAYQHVHSQFGVTNAVGMWAELLSSLATRPHSKMASHFQTVNGGQPQCTLLRSQLKRNPATV
jgi:glycosyltransferase involved in cell wall biosynthesis